MTTPRMSMQLLRVILAGCKYFAVKVHVRVLAEVLKDVSTRDSDYYDKPVEEICIELNLMLRSLVTLGLAESTDGYYSVTAKGLEDSEEFFVPVSLMNVPALCALRSRSAGRGIPEPIAA